MRHISKLALTAGSILALAGCGGSSSNSSAASFKAKASAICTKANREVAALPAINTTAALLKDLQQEITIIDPAIAQLKALTAPSAKQASFRQYLSEISQEPALTEQALAAVKAGNVAKAQQIAAQGKASGAAEHDRALSLGLPACAGNVKPGAAGSTSSST